MMTKNGLSIKTVGGGLYLSLDDLLVWSVQSWALPAESCTAAAAEGKNVAKDDRTYSLLASA